MRSTTNDFRVTFSMQDNSLTLKRGFREVIRHGNGARLSGQPDDQLGARGPGLTL